jgi:hypothetical protein
MKYIKLLFFATALAWMAVNVVGLVMAAFTGGSQMHVGLHAAFAVGCGVLAYVLRPRRRAPDLKAGDPRLEVLEAELTDLQRQLNETQRSLNFTEDLLTKRPESRKDEPS